MYKYLEINSTIHIRNDKLETNSQFLNYTNWVHDTVNLESIYVRHSLDYITLLKLITSL